MINELYELFGEIFENAQYIEWNVALIVSKSHNMTAADLFEKMQDMTMGQIVSYAKNVEFFGDSDISELEYILDKRNYLAHQFFKQNDIVKLNNNVKFLENNIRELRNVIERSMIVCESGYLDIADLPFDIQNAHYEHSNDSSPGSFELSAMERRHIARVLEYTKGNKTEAARLLKIGLTTLYRKIEEYKISDL